MSNPAPIRVCVAGVTGWTGAPSLGPCARRPTSTSLRACPDRMPTSYSSVAEALDAVEADVLVDYTHAEAVKENVSAAIERGVNVVVGSSGLSADDYAEIDEAASEHGVGVSPRATSRSRPPSCSRQRSMRRVISTPGR